MRNITLPPFLCTTQDLWLSSRSDPPPRSGMASSSPAPHAPAPVPASPAASPLHRGTSPPPAAPNYATAPFYPRSSSPPRALDAFSAIDTNNDGVIDRREWANAHARAASPPRMMRGAGGDDLFNDGGGHAADDERLLYR